MCCKIHFRASHFAVVFGKPDLQDNKSRKKPWTSHKKPKITMTKNNSCIQNSILIAIIKKTNSKHKECIKQQQNQATATAKRSRKKKRQFLEVVERDPLMFGGFFAVSPSSQSFCIFLFSNFHVRTWKCQQKTWHKMGVSKNGGTQQPGVSY